MSRETMMRAERGGAGSGGDREIRRTRGIDDGARHAARESVVASHLVCDVSNVGDELRRYSESSFTSPTSPLRRTADYRPFSSGSLGVWSMISRLGNFLSPAVTSLRRLAAGSRTRRGA